MRRSSWLVAGLLVVLGLLLLMAAGIGLHSTSMMGMMGSGYGTMSYRGMMWTMRLWGVILALIIFAGIVGLFLTCYRLIDHRNTLSCPRCSNRIHKGWEFCPYCAYDLSSDTARENATHKL